MPDPLSAAERYRRDADRFSELAQSATHPFIRVYYEHLARRSVMHAENEEKVAKIAGGFVACQDDQIPDSSSVPVAPEAASPKETAASEHPPAPAPLQPAQGPVGAPRRSRRRRPTP
jgi:hypothetical protein